MPRVRNRHEIEVVTPYRLDLTVSALRRLSTNIVDLFTVDGEYVRVLPGSRNTMIAHVRQVRADTLVACIEGAGLPEQARALSVVRRILGVDRDVSQFDRVATSMPWLRDVAVRMRGVKPPRYPTLWEACVNAILFQQVSLVAASSIARRFTLALGPARPDEIAPCPFPGVDRLRRTSDGILRAAGLSANKLSTLRRVADALQSGALDEAMLEALPSRDAVEVLRQIKGIGPWTATVILLRGLGRLDVFPMNDSSVAHNLSFVAGSARFEIHEVLQALGSQRGMLYYYLLLARLEARGELGRVSSVLAA